jgi:hypothetical protein
LLIGKRHLLWIGVAISSLWAAYWLWPEKPSEPDFSFTMHPTATPVFASPLGGIRPDMVRYQNGSFISAQGKPLHPRAVIQDARDPMNIDSPSFQAWYSLDTGSTVADFIEASEKLWAVCDTAITIATPTLTEWVMIESLENPKSCALQSDTSDRQPR